MFYYNIENIKNNFLLHSQSGNKHIDPPAPLPIVFFWSDLWILQDWKSHEPGPLQIVVTREESLRKCIHRKVVKLEGSFSL